MQSRRPATRKNGGPRRRKIALACDSCRIRKARCDGEKPICGPCRGRGLGIDQCLYKTADNARSASSDEYLRSLHDRIRELETICTNAGVTVPGFGTGETRGDSMIIENQGSNSPRQTLVPDRSLTPASRQPSATDQADDTAQTRPDTVDNPTHLYCSPRTETDVYPATPFELHSNVTGMGAISSVGEGEKAGNEYFGSSSTASLMRFLTRDGMRQRAPAAFPSPTAPHHRPAHKEGLSSLVHEFAGPTNRFQMDEVLLPPRDLADHLLDCFWDRVYCLYPFFEWQSFHDAYENLWISRSQPAKPLCDLDIGLGNKAHSGHGSMVFICALNMTFALGCHFADMPMHEREGAAHTFFLRAKRFIGLDILDIRSVGTVQAFLLTVLFLQSTPYPHRCWQSVGVACRLAQGLGLHESQLDECKHPLEREIQRRTWHGCVMMDMFVSMTYGRPTMTSHLSSVPLPECSTSEQSPPVMRFYIAAIELYEILDTILSDVYKAWIGRGSTTPTSSKGKQAKLDVIMELEEKLLNYESNLPSFLSWTSPSTLVSDSANQSILTRQRNVLHARFLYLHLLLYRPIFTQLCSESSVRTHDAARPATSQSTIYSAIVAKCAAACVKTAIRLVSVVHDTYHTPTTDTWWYNGFYTSTAGMVLIMSYTCGSVLDELDKPSIESAWAKCEQILRHMGSFSLSARNTVHFLQAARNQVLANAPETQPAGISAPSHDHQNQNSRTHFIPAYASGIEAAIQEPMNASNWDTFLGPFDLNFNDMYNWVPDGGF